MIDGDAKRWVNWLLGMVVVWGSFFFLLILWQSYESALETPERVCCLLNR